MSFFNIAGAHSQGESVYVCQHLVACLSLLCPFSHCLQSSNFSAPLHRRDRNSHEGSTKATRHPELLWFHRFCGFSWVPSLPGGKRTLYNSRSDFPLYWIPYTLCCYLPLVTGLKDKQKQPPITRP